MQDNKLKSININELIKDKKSKFCSSEEALKDVTPIAWSSDVLSNNRICEDKNCCLQNKRNMI